MPNDDARKPLSPRESGKFIAEHSEDVTIDEAGIEVAGAMLSECFVTEDFSMASWKKEVLHPDVANEDSINFIFLMDSLNFCFWHEDPSKAFKVVYNEKEYTGFWSLVAALRRAVDDGIPLSSAKYMASVTENQLEYILRSDSGVPIPMLKERVGVLNEAGSVLMEKFDGSFVNCIRKSNKDAVALVDLVTSNFSSYRDEAMLNSQPVSFHKRAQILVADIWLCYEGKDLGEFHNINKLTMFADYRVPQALEYFGILQYSNKLKKVLNDMTVLEKGSRYEIEIRGCSIEAIERLKTAICLTLTSRGIKTTGSDTMAPVNSITVDNYLWTYAKSHAIKMGHLAHHRVYTVFY